MGLINDTTIKKTILYNLGNGDPATDIAFDFQTGTGPVAASVLSIQRNSNVTGVGSAAFNGLRTEGRISLKQTISAAGTLSLSTNLSNYVFNGTTSTWTLPALSGNEGMFYFIKNRGSGILTINVTGGGAEIYGSSAVSSYVMNPGDAFIFSDDGTFWNVQ